VETPELILACPSRGGSWL